MKFGVKFNKKLIIPLIITISIPLTVGLALTQQNLLKFAGGGPEIASVAIHPGEINSDVGMKSQPLSTLAYDLSGSPIYSGVTYEWSMSSTNSVGTLTKTQGEISEFLPLAPGCGQITVVARKNTDLVTKSASVAVSSSSSGAFIPDCSPSLTQSPTLSPTGTPTPVANQTFLNLIVGIDGIGTTRRIPIGGNKNPDSIYRNLTVKLYDATTNSPFGTYFEKPFTYNPAFEKFEAKLEVPLTLGESEILNLYVEGPRFLRAQYPGSTSIKQGQTINLSLNNFYLITGNINNSDISENRIDIMDYNVLLSCSIYSQDVSACQQDSNYADYSDLNDDGLVDEDDFTLWLKEFTNQEGALLP